MIELRDVCLDYRTDGGMISALRGIDLKIGEGESVAILGSNGSGKTTLVRCLNGLLKPSRGEVVVDGLRMDGSGATLQVRRKVGMVFQNPDNQIVATPVEREIAFGLENLGLPREEIRERVEWALNSFRLEEMRLVPPHLLSGGEKQRLAIASVLAMRPKYVVLDEPTSLLDPRGREELLQVIADLGHRPDLTVIHITQFPREAMFARRLLVMFRGRMLMDGDPGDILARGRELEEIGLCPPTVTQVAMGLTKRRIFLSSAAHRTVRGLVGELTERWGKSGENPARNAEGRGTCIPPEGPDRIIEIDSVSYTYDSGLPWGKEALTGVDLTVRAGEFIGLMGPTGSGKTTLAQHLNGLLTPTRGRVAIGGVELCGKDGLTRAQRRVGLVFQFPEAQLFGETVYEDVAFVLRNRGLPDEEVEERVGEALRAVGLDMARFGERSPFSLSYGEQRRVAVAGILIMRPEILVLDEPTVGLDPQGTEEVGRWVRDFHRAGGTVIFISHQVDLVFRWSERILVLHRGKVVEDASPSRMAREEKRLRQLGLDLPVTCQIMGKLRGAGWGVRVDLFSPEEVATEIARYIYRGAKRDNSLVSQGDNGVELRRPGGRVDAEEQTDGGSKAETEKNRPDGD